MRDISRIRLSNKISRLHPRHVVPKPAQKPEVPVEVPRVDKSRPPLLHLTIYNAAPKVMPVLSDAREKEEARGHQEMRPLLPLGFLHAIHPLFSEPISPCSEVCSVN
jgi:hypothetical protein